MIKEITVNLKGPISLLEGNIGKFDSFEAATRNFKIQTYKLPQNGIFSYTIQLAYRDGEVFSLTVPVRRGQEIDFEDLTLKYIRDQAAMYDPKKYSSRTQHYLAAKRILEKYYLENTPGFKIPIRIGV